MAPTRKRKKEIDATKAAPSKRSKPEADPLVDPASLENHPVLYIEHCRS